MWLTVKEAARAKGRGRGAPVPVNPQTLADLKEYDALKAEFPDVESPSADIYGMPDQVAHLELLRNLKKQKNEEEAAAARPASDLPRRTPRTPPRLPERDPGWYTSPESQSAGFGVPPLERRTPGESLRPSNAPGYAPDPQSMQDWVKWLNSKGITVDHTLQRPDAAQRQEPYRPLTGPEIWHQFVGPSTDESLDTALHGLPQDMGGLGRSWKQRAKDLFSRRRASAVVADYINGVLVTAGVRDTMENEGWTHHESGSGNWYQKKIGDQVHVIVSQPGGWIHNFGPSAEEMSDNPRWHDNLSDAVMSANRHGKVQVGFKAAPPSIHRFNSWSGV